MGHAFRSVATTQSRQPANSNAAGAHRNRREFSFCQTPMRGRCEFSSCRTPIRHPRRGSEVGTRDIHNSQTARQPPLPSPPCSDWGQVRIFVLPDSDPVPTVGLGGRYARHVQLPSGRQSFTFITPYSYVEPVRNFVLPDSDPAPTVGLGGRYARHPQLPSGRQHPLSSRRVAGHQPTTALNPRRDKIKDANSTTAALTPTRPIPPPFVAPQHDQ